MNKKNIDLIVMQYSKTLDRVEKYKRLVEESQHKVDNFIGDVDYEVEKLEDLKEVYYMYEAEADELFNKLLKEVGRYEYGERMRKIRKIRENT